MGCGMVRAMGPALLLGVAGCSGLPGGGLKITDVRPGEFKVYSESVGDTWDPTWADDDQLYAASNDTSGWNEACSSNVAFNRMTGDDFLNLNGATVNGMSESGGWGAGDGPDGRTWKTSGCMCVDGVLYLVIARHMYSDKSKECFGRQSAINSSIIKSTDYGRTWTRSFAECYERPMFPRNCFATPYFFHYGKDGAAPRVDGADEYIYAVSNNGFWNNGDRYFLGRVRRSDLARLEAGDWQFYTGDDGLHDENWSKDSAAATALIENPTRCGMTGATYIPSIGRYILIAWYYPRNPDTDSNETRFNYYEAPHPWGPWTFIREDINRPAGWYSPRVLSRWQTRKGGEVDVVVATGGDFWEIPWFYKLAVMPLKLKTDGRFAPPPPAPAVVVVKCDQTGEGLGKFSYRGTWEYGEHNKDWGLGEYRSAQAGDSLTITFEGRRIRWYSCKGNAVGIATVSVDGGPETTIDLWTRWCPETLYNRLAYDSGPLPAGRHAFAVKVTGRKNEKSIGNNVYNARVEIEK
jgi:hypothetical protein